MKHLSLVVLTLLMFCGCANRVAMVGKADRVCFTDTMLLYQRPLELKLSRPSSPTPGYLVVFATGDGGWHSVDQALFDWIAAYDYPVVGFSSKNYLKNLGYVSDTGTTTPQRLKDDFRQVITAAELKLGLPGDTHVILAGMSRGAGLVVVAAGQRDFQHYLAGVVAVALTREEEHVVRYRRRAGDPQGDHRPRELVEIKTYEYLRRLGTLPVAVIQSTHDGYLPANKARQLFGADTESRRLEAVEARNHTFGGGLDVLRRDLESALRWIERRETSAGH